MLIRDIMETSTASFGSLPAVKWLKKKDVLSRTYDDLMESITLIRKGLAANGMTHKHIALIGSSSYEWISCYLGIITGSSTAVPLDAGLPKEDLMDLINRSDAEALLISPKLSSYIELFQTGCPKLKKIWQLSEEGVSDLMCAGKSAASDSHRPAEDDIATIIFTSGTTGKSKGVMLTQQNLASNVLSVDYTVDPGTTLLSVLPIHHAFCLVMDWLKGFSLGGEATFRMLFLLACPVNVADAGRPFLSIISVGIVSIY